MEQLLARVLDAAPEGDRIERLREAMLELALASPEAVDAALSVLMAFEAAPSLTAELQLRAALGLLRRAGQGR